MAAWHPELGTPSQRRGLVIVLGLLIFILGVRLMLNRQTVPDVQPAQAPAADQLADRIDPNTATEAELAGIPRLGEKRAAAIVEYREQSMAAHPGREVFGGVRDLQRVKGVGPATAEMIGPYLVFPPLSATRP